MNGPVIIGLLGSEGSGKSNAAAYLAEHYGAVRRHSGDPMKRLVMKAFDLRPEQVFGTQAEKNEIDPRYNVSGRWLCQHVGTEGCMSVFGDDVWIKKCLEEFENPPVPQLVVIENLRLLVDVDYLTLWTDWNNVHKQVWRLELPNAPATNPNAHATESEWQRAPHDYVIAPKVRGLDELYREVDIACAQFGIKKIERAA